MLKSCYHYVIEIFFYFYVCRCYPINTILADPNQLDRKLREYYQKMRQSQCNSDESDDDSDSSCSSDSDTDTSDSSEVSLNLYLLTAFIH